eukprot:6230797-Alexandrium_andersonii.AAC.1
MGEAERSEDLLEQKRKGATICICTDNEVWQHTHGHVSMRSWTLRSINTDMFIYRKEHRSPTA